MFDGRLPEGFGVPQPRDGDALTEDEDPLEDGAIDLFDEQPLIPGDGDEATGEVASLAEADFVAEAEADAASDEPEGPQQA